MIGEISFRMDCRGGSVPFSIPHEGVMCECTHEKRVRNECVFNNIRRD